MTPSDFTLGFGAACLLILALFALGVLAAVVVAWRWAARFASVELEKDDTGRVNGAFVVRGEEFRTEQPKV